EHDGHRHALDEDPEHARLGQLAEREEQRGDDRRHPRLRLRARQAKSTPRTPRGPSRPSRLPLATEGFMTQPTYDVIAIGNAIVAILAPGEDGLIEQLQLNRGGMTLVDAARARELYDAMGPAREVSGGSAANTLAGLAALGARCAFIGQVANDQFGRVFAHDIRSVGIDFETPAREGEPPTAQCLIFVSPDGQRDRKSVV